MVPSMIFPILHAEPLRMDALCGRTTGDVKSVQLRHQSPPPSSMHRLRNAILSIERAMSLLKSSPQLWCGALVRAVSQVENWDISVSAQRVRAGNIHSSTQSSLGCFLSTGFPSSAPVTRSTHSSKWCFAGEHCFDSLHSVND